MYSSRFFTGLISLCFMSFSAVLWGSKWDSQKEVSQCKHDLIAVRIFFFGQLSQDTSDFSWTCFLWCPHNFFNGSIYVKSCFESNAFLHMWAPWAWTMVSVASDCRPCRSCGHMKWLHGQWTRPDYGTCDAFFRRTAGGSHDFTAKIINKQPSVIHQYTSVIVLI